MNWSDERYARLYTRDTPEWMCLPWQARATWPLLIRKFDRSGVLATKLGARGVAVLVGLPVEVVEVGIQALLDDGCLEVHELGYVAPNFTEAQEAIASDAQRKRRERERRRGVTKRDKASRNVTKSHAASQSVTGVTPSRAVPSDPSRSEPNQDTEVSAKPTVPAKSKRQPFTEPELGSVATILDRLSERSGVKYRGSDKHTALIVARLRQGITEWDMRRVIGYCAVKLGWQVDPKMRAWLRPETLFGPEAIERYLDPARTWEPAESPAAPNAQAPPKREIVQPRANGGLAEAMGAVLPFPFDREPAKTMDDDPALQEPAWMTTT